MPEPLADLAPSVRRALAKIAAMPVEAGTVEELGIIRARERTRQIWASYWSGAPIRLSHVSDHRVETSHGPVPIRLYDSSSNHAAPLLYAHGGGFVLGDLDTHDVIPRHLALYSGRPVISIGYRLAPEHRYPAAIEDIIAVAEAVAGNATGLEIDGAGMTLGGDSAGASLALSAALRLRGSLAAPVALLLLFGCYDPTVRGASAALYGTGYGLALSDVRWFWRQYLGERFSDPPLDAAPLAADLRGLPPVYLGVPACDPLRSDSETLRDRLSTAGAQPAFRLWPGMIHGCIGMGRDLDEAHAQLADAAVWIAHLP